MGLEPIRHTTHAPQTCLSANSSTTAYSIGASQMQQWYYIQKRAGCQYLCLKNFWIKKAADPCDQPLFLAFFFINIGIMEGRRNSFRRPNKYYYNTLFAQGVSKSFGFFLVHFAYRQERLHPLYWSQKETPRTNNREEDREWKDWFQWHLVILHPTRKTELMQKGMSPKD